MRAFRHVADRGRVIAVPAEAGDRRLRQLRAPALNQCRIFDGGLDRGWCGGFG